MKGTFDIIEYYKDLAKKNKLAKSNKFFACQCSGISSLEDVLANLQTQHSFIAVDDTNDGSYEMLSGGYFKKRTVTVFIISRYDFGDMNDRKKSLNLCRSIFKQFISKMIKDSNKLEQQQVFVDTSRVFSRELGAYFIDGCTGLYFMVDISQPEELIYNVEEWEG